MNDLEVLPARVKDLQHLFVVHEQVEQGLEVEPFGFGVDRRRFFAARDLDQAEVGPVGVLAHELGVHGDEGVSGEAVD